MKMQQVRDGLRKVERVDVRGERLAREGLARRYRSVFLEGGGPRRPLMIMLDISAPSLFGCRPTSKLELSAGFAAALAHAAQKNGEEVGLVLFTDRIELYLAPSSDPRHLRRIIREILYFPPQGEETAFPEVFGAVRRFLRPSRLVLLSDFFLPGTFAESLENLRQELLFTKQRHEVVVASVIDPSAFEMPDLGLLTLQNPDTGESLEFDTGEPELRWAYARETARRRMALRYCIRFCGIDHLELSTDRPFLPALRSFLEIRRAGSTS
ncbi:MAG: hypothetical protein O7E54_13035 [Planctomycetota bacterium]|nr:hypothetical protein [Planctomycetota bacterium]